MHLPGICVLLQKVNFHWNDLHRLMFAMPATLDSSVQYLLTPYVPSFKKMHSMSYKVTSHTRCTEILFWIFSQIYICHYFWLWTLQTSAWQTMSCLYCLSSLGWVPYFASSTITSLVFSFDVALKDQWIVRTTFEQLNTLCFPVCGCILK